MKQKYHIISSVVSMVVTAVLLVCVCLAWYVTNQEAKVSGTVGNVIDGENLIEKVEYYEVSNKTTQSGETTYTFGSKITPTAEGIEMGTYNPLSSTTYPQRLMVITLSKEYYVQVSAITSAEDYLGATIKDENGDFILTKDGKKNSLTSVIGFYYLSDVTLTGDVPTTSTLPETAEKKAFADIDTNTVSKNVNIISKSESSNKVYILLDYYEESIEHIYSLNIGNEALNPTDEESVLGHGNDIKYTCDFYFVIQEVGA